MDSSQYRKCNLGKHLCTIENALSYQTSHTISLLCSAVVMPRANEITHVDIEKIRITMNKVNYHYRRIPLYNKNSPTYRFKDCISTTFYKLHQLYRFHCRKFIVHTSWRPTFFVFEKTQVLLISTVCREHGQHLVYGFYPWRISAIALHGIAITAKDRAMLFTQLKQGALYYARCGEERRNAVTLRGFETNLAG